MAPVNLRAAFMTGIDPSITAQQVFTDRVNEISAFYSALRNLDEHLDGAAVSPVVDRSQGRRNLLCFYGVGGIGKTTLSQEIERRFTAETGDRKRADTASVRIDLADEGATDLESILIRLRAGLGQMSSRWLAFDLALSCYWVRAHPGESLQEFLDTAPLVRRAAKTLRLGDQLAANLESLVPTDVVGFPGLAQRAGLNVYRTVRDRMRKGRLLSDCDMLAELIEAEADNETLSFFPYLLAWDFDQISSRADQRPSVCVFLDTFEAVNDREHRDTEKLLRRCMYLMPNVLFVVTGRNRIDWAETDPAADPDFTGPARWPNLHYSNRTEEPRQHLVGFLSDADADDHLRRAMTKEGRPLIPGEIRRRIVTGAQGLPLYLDLSISHFAALSDRGSPPLPEDFGGSFTEVATRSLRDLPREERDLVRTASLVDRFDADLLRAGQPDTSDGQLTRFLKRPFLLLDDAYELPYSLHTAVRSAIEAADETLPDGWSDRDRADVATRILRDLGERLGAMTDRSTTARTLEIGWKLAVGQNVFDPWLVRATHQLIEAGQWLALRELRPDHQSEPSKLGSLSAAVDGVLLRRTGDPRQAVAHLEGACSSTVHDTDVGDLLRLHLAHALRNTGDYSDAADIYRVLLDGDFGDVARYWLCDYDFLNGRFETALAELGSWGGRDAAEEGERLRLLGHVARVNARAGQAAERYHEAVDLARAEGLAAAEAKALTNLVQTRCWAGDVADVEKIARQARELLDLVPNPVELVKLRSAEAIVAAQAGQPKTAATALADTRRLADDIGYRGGHNLADVASILIDVRREDAAAARQTLEDLDQRTRSSGGNTYWVPIAASWIDGVEAATHRGPDIEWLDGPAETLGLWALMAT